MSSSLSRAEIRRAFERLSDELARREVRAECFVVGGAAIAMAYATRRVTRDVDAIFEPKAVVYDAARVVAGELSLPDDWLNDAVKAFAPGEDHERRVVLRTPSLSVSVASPRYLLAMKLLAARVDQDVEDIKLLYELCSFTTADEGMDLVEAAYPGHPVEARTASSSGRCTVPVMMAGDTNRHQPLEAEACQVHRCPCQSARRSPLR